MRDIVWRLGLCLCTLVLALTGCSDKPLLISSVPTSGVPLVGVKSGDKPLVVVGERIWQGTAEGLRPYAAVAQSYSIRADRPLVFGMYTQGVVHARNEMLMRRSGSDYGPPGTGEGRMSYTEVVAMSFDDDGVSGQPLLLTYGTVASLHATEQQRVLVEVDEHDLTDGGQRVDCFERRASGWRRVWTYPDDASEDGAVVASMPGGPGKVLLLVARGERVEALVLDEATGEMTTSLSLDAKGDWRVLSTGDKQVPWLLWRRHTESIEAHLVSPAGSAEVFSLKGANDVLACSDLCAAPGVEIVVRSGSSRVAVWTSTAEPEILGEVRANASYAISVDGSSGESLLLIEPADAKAGDMGFPASFALVRVDREGRMKISKEWIEKAATVSVVAADLDSDGVDEVLVGVADENGPALRTVQLDADS